MQITHRVTHDPLIILLQFNNPNRPDALQKVSIPTVTDEECRRAYGPTDMFDSFICAGVAEGDLKTDGHCNNIRNCECIIDQVGLIRAMEIPAGPCSRQASRES